MQPNKCVLRGATRDEVVDTLRESDVSPAKNGRLASRKTFRYHSISPINHLFYELKSVDVIWVDEPLEIVVVTVKVYYHE